MTTFVQLEPDELRGRRGVEAGRLSPPFRPLPSLRRPPVCCHCPRLPRRRHSDGRQQQPHLQRVSALQRGRGLQRTGRWQRQSVCHHHRVETGEILCKLILRTERIKVISYRKCSVEVYGRTPWRICLQLVFRLWRQIE